MTTQYKALLVAPDGAWVTDYRESETIEEVQLRLADQGSRWYFYPFHAVITDRGSTRDTQRIVDAAEPFEYMRGRTIRTFAATIAALPESTLEAILS